MKSFIIATAVLSLVLNFVPFSEGLRCYICASFEGIEIPPEFGDIIDISCKNGSTPNDKFLQTCSDTQTSCSKLTLKGRMSTDPTELEVTLRTCVGLEDTMKGSCAKQSVAEIKRNPDFPADLTPLLDIFTSNSIADYCFCEQNACNKEKVEEKDKDLQCYTCASVDGLDVELPPDFTANTDKSCKFGGTPDQKLLKKCLPTGPGKKATCGTVHVTGRKEEGGAMGEMTFRGCREVVANATEECIKHAVGDLGEDEEIPEVPDVLLDALKQLSKDTIVDVCGCEGDGCNKEEPSGNGDSSGNTLRTSFMGLFVVTVATLSLLKI